MHILCYLAERRHTHASYDGPKEWRNVIGYLLIAIVYINEGVHQKNLNLR